MDTKRNKKILCLAASALVLTADVSAGRTMAYFTTYASAGGGAQLNLGFTTAEPPEETFSDWTKFITVRNTGAQECFARVRVFAGGGYQENLTYADDNGKWTPGGDGYYYYQDVLAPEGGTADVLRVRINGVEEEDRDAFNVIVIQEYSLVTYDEAGNPVYNWNRPADTGDGEVQE